MPEPDETEHARAQNELDDLRRALRNPRIGLLATRAAYRRMGELYAILDDTKDIPEHELSH